MIRYWELRRIPYNLGLAVAGLIWVVWTWPHFRPAFEPITLLPLAVLAVLANVCYSAVYGIELLAAAARVPMGWRRWRAALWIAGMLLALLIENYWIADEIYPYVPFRG